MCTRASSGHLNPHRLLLLLACLVLFLNASEAQTYAVGLHSSFGPRAPARFEPFFIVSDIDADGARLELRVAGLLRGPLEFGYGFRQNTSLGPIGNVTLRGRTDIDTGGAFDFIFSGDGVIGPVAARARLGIFNTNPGRFALLDLFGDIRPIIEPERLEGQVGFTLGGGVTYRIDRNLILDADPTFYYLTGMGFGFQLSSSLRFSRLVDTDDGVIVGLGGLEPGGDSGFAAVGFEYRLNRRDLPVVRGSLWLGAGSAGFAPGVRLLVSETRLAEPLRYSVEAAAEPFRTDIAPYRLNLMLGFDAGPGVLELRALGAAGGSFSEPSLGVGTAFSWRP